MGAGLAILAIAATVGSSIYSADQQRKLAHEAEDAAYERQQQLLAAEEEAARLAEIQRKEATQEVELGKLDIGEEDTAAVRRSKALGKARFIVEREESQRATAERLQIGTSTPRSGSGGIQV